MNPVAGTLALTAGAVLSSAGGGGGAGAALLIIPYTVIFVVSAKNSHGGKRVRRPGCDPRPDPDG